MDEPVRIPLSHDQHALVDAADFPLLAPFRWHAENRNGRWFAARRERSGGNGARWRTIMMHRQLLDALPGTLVVHVNGDSLDNRRSNLRVVTRREVGMQRRPNRNNASGYKGVTRERRTGRWRAVLTVAGGRCRWGITRQLRRRRGCMTRRRWRCTGNWRGATSRRLLVRRTMPAAREKRRTRRRMVPVGWRCVRPGQHDTPSHSTAARVRNVCVKAEERCVP